MMSNQIFALGSNGSGQLGLGHQEDVSIPTRSLFEDDISALQPHKIAAGGNHTLILFVDGSLYATGQNSDGRCGLGSTSNIVNAFRRVVISTGAERITKFRDCSATWEASTLITQDGLVFTCGTGRKGELGQGKSCNELNSPQQIANFPPQGTGVVSPEDFGLEASMSHTVAVRSDGTLYGWGSGRKGELGDPREHAWTPRKIELPSRVACAVCGRDFTFIVGRQLDTDNPFALLGSAKSFGIAIPNFKPTWKDLGASWSGFHVLYGDGTVQSWGRNDHKQLAPESLPKLDSIAVGSEHVIGLTSSGQVIAWGWGEHGNCGRTNNSTANGKGLFNIIDVEGQPQGVWAGCSTSWIHVKARSSDTPG